MFLIIIMFLSLVMEYQIKSEQSSVTDIINFINFYEINILFLLL